MDVVLITSPLKPDNVKTKPGKGEIAAWAMYDVANATYATVVATAVYNAYFVNVIAEHVGAVGHGMGTLLLTITICISAILIVLSAPILGTIADATGSKKRILFWSTVVCIMSTASLSLWGPGQYIPAMIALCLANLSFGTGENFVASFLPELATKEDMGRVSALGWAAGYIGGLISLGGALAYLYWCDKHGVKAEVFVPVIVIGCALVFALLATPTFLFLKERAIPDPAIVPGDYIRVGFERLQTTFRHARHYEDLFNLLVTICVYSCGSLTVVHLASVYAQNVLKFTAKESLIMILVVDFTAAVGAGIFGYVQDRIGSVKTLAIALAVWTLAIFLAYHAQSKADLWIAGNFVGFCMGASGSAGRALVGQFSPPGRSGEFLGLWGVAMKLATAIGAISFGLITYVTHSNFRVALLSTLVFFVCGLILLFRVNEERGIQAAHRPFNDDRDDAALRF